MNKEVYLSSSATIPFKVITSLFFPFLLILGSYSTFNSPRKDALLAGLVFLIGSVIMGVLIWNLMRNTVSAKIIGNKIYFSRWKKEIAFSRNDIETVFVNSYLSSYTIEMKNGERYRFPVSFDRSDKSELNKKFELINLLIGPVKIKKWFDFEN
jgi:hypothetical protein